MVCFEAATPAEAIAKAKSESEEYAADNGFEFIQERVTYEQDGDALIDGYEVWSELFESDQTLAEFYADRYSRFEYNPE